MKHVIVRLSAEPTAVGALFSTILPALVALGVLTMDAETIGILVVAVNAVVAFVVRMLVTPATAPPDTAPAPVR